MLASPAAREEKEKKKHKPAKELPTLQLTVKKGAPPPPNFHRLNTHYASSHSPTRYETFIEDKYAPAQPPPPAPTKTTTPTAAATTDMFGNYVPSNRATLSKSSINDQSAIKKPARNVPVGIDPLENLFFRSNETVEESVEEWPSLIKQPKISQAPSLTVIPKPMERTVKSADERWTSLNLQPKDSKTSTPSVKPKLTKAPTPAVTPEPMEKKVKPSDANKKQVEEEWPSLSRQPMVTKASNPFENVKPIKNFVVAAKVVKNTVESKTREVLKKEFIVERSPSNLEWEEWNSEVKERVVERSRSPSFETDNWNSEMSEPVPTLNFKTFKSVEIQTDETSFPQTFEQRQNFVSPIDYHSGRYSVSPKLSRPSNELRRNTEITTSSGFGSGGASPLQTIALSKFPAIVTFLFKNDNTFAIEIDQNGKIEKLNNNFDNEWTPLYLSMKERSLEIGEMAQIHYLEFPKFVVYDILNIIGKPLNQIEINPYWQFNVIDNNGIKCFEVETSNGLRLIPEDTVLAAFLKKMKEKAENNLNTEIREIFISSNFGFTESQKNVFKNAALKIGLNVLEFFVNNI
uniref:Uncharacterized protein n=1 Tax=Panagrolaimus davidi TaxID=227884 RepID=A0A914QC84_9BILA